MKKILGFTLIEVMIVVAIIGILASVAIPAYEKATGSDQKEQTFQQSGMESK